jgi:hypothetical protein
VRAGSSSSLFVRLVADGWCWFVPREKYCWLVADDWFVLREKYCWLVADKPSEQAVNLYFEEFLWFEQEAKRNFGLHLAERDLDGKELEDMHH